MRISIFTLMAIMSAACVCAALSQLQFETGVVGFIVLAAVLMFLVPKQAWRYCFYGGIGGIAIGIALMLIHTYISLGHISGSYAVTDFVFAWRPWILFGGSWVGGTTGFLLFQTHSSLTQNPN